MLLVSKQKDFSVFLMPGYQPIWREPLVGKYGEYEVYAPPAPASGGILLSALGTLDVLEKKGDGSVNGAANGTANGTDGASTDSDRATHNLIEALRLAYGQRVLLGDPAYVPGLEGVQAAWLAPGAAEERAAKIRETTREPAFYLAYVPKYYVHLIAGQTPLPLKTAVHRTLRRRTGTAGCAALRLPLGSSSPRASCSRAGSC